MQTYIFFANCATLNAKKMTTQLFSALLSFSLQTGFRKSQLIVIFAEIYHSDESK